MICPREHEGADQCDRNMKPADIEFISRLPFFEGIDHDVLAQLARGALLQRYPQDTLLFEEGQTPDFLHVLIDGAVELFAGTSDGKRTSIEIVKPVDSFILAAALTDTPYLMSARVIEPAQLWLIPTENLRKQMTQDNRFALKLTANLAGHFRSMVRQVKNLKLRNAAQRLGCYILALADEQGRTDHVELQYEKRLIASRLSMTSENLSRTFMILGDHGVRIQGKHIHIDDVEELRAFCKPDHLFDGRDINLTIS
jgi:CRP/FNR family transcriptional activator FtrB